MTVPRKSEADSSQPGHCDWRAA